MKNKTKFILIILIFLISCNEDERRDNNFYENVVKGKTVVLKKVRQFVIREKSDSFIGNFLFVKYRMNYLVIADYLQPILFFIDKSNGQIVKTIKFKRGRGPGEVLKIGSFEILKNRIYISDMGNFRWSVFDTSGNYIMTANPFVDAPKTSSEEKKGGYEGNGNIMDIYEDKIYNCIIEAKYNRDLHQHKSKALVILDSTLTIKKSFGFMDEIFGKFKTYFINAMLTVDDNGYIFFTQAPTYRIYKFYKDGSFIKAFGIQGKFRMIEEDIPTNLAIPEIIKKTLTFSVSDAIFSYPKGYVLHQFLDRTEKLYETNNLLDNNYYLKVYDTEGNYINSDLKLPGWLISVDEKGLLYIYENNEPENRIVGIYELNTIKK